MNEPWQIQLLGGLRLRQGERGVTRFRTQKTGALLAFLAYHIQHSHAREVLIERFWPDTTLESGRHNLSHALSSLRSLLEPPGVPAGTVVVADRFTVALNPDACVTDVALFDAALRRAAQSRATPEFGALLDAALTLYTGPLLPGYYEEWIVPAQERLRQRFQEALSERAALHQSAGRVVDAIALSQNALDLDPDLDAVPDLLDRLRRQTPDPAPPRPVRPVPDATALPTGTVTVLMTDIEGSTALFERHGDPYRAALADHHRLLRHAFGQYGGHEIKEVGDAFVVLFGSVGDALSGGLACQRALSENTWPEGIDMKVRMALHTGDIEREAGEYRGLLLHRASRILSAAHGGQLLCSEPTARLLARDLAPDVRLQDLGLWRLRDLPEPERLFQLSGGETTEFPALRATPAHSAHLPLQFTRFFGREEEIARIGELLHRGTRLLTLTGPGGTGKTRLAIEGVAQFADRYDGAVWFVPLADLSDPQFIPQAILQALGVPLVGSKDPWEQAATALTRQDTLLILDNFEQLVDGGAEGVQALLERTPSLRCVATSRQILGLPAEVEFPVAPLPTPNADDPLDQFSLYDSVRLFVDRAQAARPDFRITAQNAPALAELCDRLEGIPLAIELAAARALVLSPTQMLAHLGNRFEFLVSRRRGVSERQKTLRAAIDWSYRLLDPSLQRFFARLSVFRGGWNLEAAETVCEEPLALDLLAQLRECSLVSAHGSAAGVRFRMLETLREYAGERLEEDERHALEARLDDFLLHLSVAAEPHWNGPEQRVWVDRQEAEFDNLRDALTRNGAEGGDLELACRLACGFEPIWFMRGYLREARGWLDRLRSQGIEQVDPAVRARLLRASGEIAWHELRLAPALADLEESLALFRALDLRRDIALSLHYMARVCVDSEDDGRGIQLTAEALALFEEVGDRRNVAVCTYQSHLEAFRRGDVEEGFRIMHEGLAVFREFGSPRQVAVVLSNIGDNLAIRGRAAESRPYLEESLALCRSNGDHRGVLVALGLLGRAARRLGELDTADVLYRQGIRYNWPRTFAYYYLILDNVGEWAEVVAIQGDPLRAARFWGAVDRYREGIGWCRLGTDPLPVGTWIPPTLDDLARARAAAGDEAFDRAWSEGRALPWTEVIESIKEP